MAVKVLMAVKVMMDEKKDLMYVTTMVLKSLC